MAQITWIASSIFFIKELLQARTVRLAAFAISVAILALELSAQAQTFTVLHAFTGGSDGATPETGLTIDRQGKLYGTTSGLEIGVGGIQP